MHLSELSIEKKITCEKFSEKIFVTHEIVNNTQSYLY